MIDRVKLEGRVTSDIRDGIKEGALPWEIACEVIAVVMAETGWRPIAEAPRISGELIDLWVVPGKSLHGFELLPYREARMRRS
jgi:hypothetical protein